MDPEAASSHPALDEEEKDLEQDAASKESGRGGAINGVPTQKNEHEDGLTKSQSTVSIGDTLSTPRQVLFVAVICLAQFCTQVGLGSVLSIIHVIGDYYAITNSGTLSWLIAGYSLTVGTFILLSGRLGDVFGYKKMLLIGYAWFSVWSMVAGLAAFSNSVLFIFARVLQGIGPSIILTNGLAILGSSYSPGPRKNFAFAAFGALAPIGSVVGSTSSAIFAEFTWWPWSFWSFSLVLAALYVLAFFVIPDPPRKTKVQSLRSKIEDLDLLGGLIGVTSLILINFAWNQSGVVGWQEAYVYVCLILGVFLLPAFFWVEICYARSPLIPFLALSSDVAFVLACVGCGWACFGIWVYYIWNFLEELRGASPLLTSAMLSPVTISGACASIATGFVLGRLRPAWVMTLALTCFTIGTILIATAPVDQTYWAQTFVCTVVIPWGMDMSFPAATLILSDAVPRDKQGIGASLVNTVVNYSISLGLGLAGTVESQVNRGGTTPADVLLGYRGAFYMGIGLSGFGLFLSLTFVAKGYLKDRRSAKVANK